MNTRIHILHYGLADSFHVGGIETYIKKIIDHIDLNRFQIDFLVFKGSEPCFYEDLLSKGCKFHFVTSRKQSNYKNIYEIRNLYKKENFDIIHCHQNSLSYITPCIEACKMHIPVIVHSRNASMVASPLSKFLHWINYYRLQKLPVIRVAVSDLAGKWMFGKKEFAVLNNGVDTRLFSFSQKNRDRIRKSLNIEAETEVFLNVGKFRKQKNHLFLLRVFAEYLKINPKAVLLLVGDGELKDEIKKKIVEYGIVEKVFLLGARKDVSQILSAADKFLFPSLYEGFPNALIEAECSGLQCVVSDTITKQAVFSELCEALSLNEPIEKWCKVMSKDVNIIDRMDASLVVEQRGLDINSEIQRISNLYTQLISRKFCK